MDPEDRAPRRVSMAYVLGFSNEPFKKPKSAAPEEVPKQSKASQMMHTPGGLVEWAASDGRKGKLTGVGAACHTSKGSVKTSSQKGGARGNNDEEKKGPTKESATKKDEKKKGPRANASKKNEEKKNPAKGSVAKKDEEKKDGSDEAASALFALFDANEDTDSFSRWTPWQDAKLMEYKNFINGDWENCATALGKEIQDCKNRFSIIKPKDWRPTKKACRPIQQGEGQSKKKGQNKDKKNAEKEKEVKEENGSKAAKPTGWGQGDTANGNDENGGAGNNPWGEVNGKSSWGIKRRSGKRKHITWSTWANKGWGEDNGSMKHGSVENDESDSKDTNNGAAWNTGDNKGWNNDSSSKKDNAENNGAWDNNDASGDTAWNNNDTSGDAAWDKNDNTGGADGWGNTDVKDQKSTSNKDDAWGQQHSKAGSATSTKKASKKEPKSSSDKNHHVEKNSNAPGVDLQLKPDDNFSARDLLLVARIVKQDHEMLWDRVSWRFKDKTGRTLPPATFQRKIIGLADKEDKKGECKK